MSRWAAFPHVNDYSFDVAALEKHWARLHACDAEPLPEDPAVRQAWALYHCGQFQQAVQAGLSAGGPGITVANKATVIYASYLERKEKNKLDLLMQVAERAQTQAAQEPRNANAWFCQGFALGRYSQGISVARALAQGLGSRVKETLERAIQLQPRHADAHIALGAFHAEVIDKVGALIGGMTYGAKRETGLKLFQEALRLNPASPIALSEYAKALLMLEGEGKMREATRLYQEACACKPIDAVEHLEVELAKSELH